MHEFHFWWPIAAVLAGVANVVILESIDRSVRRYARYLNRKD